MLIKICGITNYEDASIAADAGADFLGFIFFAKSHRAVSRDAAKDIIECVKRAAVDRTAPLAVGVFVNESCDKICEHVRVCGLDVVQLHGEESAEFCSNLRSRACVKVIKALKIKDSFSLRGFETYKGAVDYFLCDTYSETAKGGTGEAFNHSLIKEYVPKHKIILAGGLKPENIAGILNTIKPCGVDVASGIELSPGKKDHDELRDFIKIVRENE